MKNIFKLTAVFTSIVIIQIVACHTVKGQNLEFHRGLGQSNYVGISTDSEQGEIYVDTLKVSVGGNGLLTHKVVYCNTVYAEENGKVLLRGISAVFYRNSSNIVDRTENNMSYRLTPAKRLSEFFPYMGGFLEVRQNGKRMAVSQNGKPSKGGTYTQIKNTYLKNGYYSIYADGKLLVFNRLVR